MKLAAVSQRALLKLMQLDQIAQQLSAEADRLDARIASLRHKATGSGWNAAIEAELKELLAAQPQVRQRADRAQHTASGCKAWLACLPDDARLEPVQIKLNGASLGSVREQLSALQQQRRALINAPPSPAEMADEVKRWVAMIAEQGKPSRLVDAGFAPKWGGSAVVDASDRPRNAFAFLCWLVPDVVAQRLQQELEAQASEISKLSRDERRARLDAIEHQIDELRYGEEQLLDGAERTSDTPPAAVLGVKVVAPENAT
jgi:hypothetical protein